jgi:hypothetical protein
MTLRASGPQDDMFFLRSFSEITELPVGLGYFTIRVRVIGGRGRFLVELAGVALGVRTML